ncbi:hypothetical protein G7Y79_00113g101700 [Physcia stellaris]|nr:hypothetical protein G7Y79_00113g101700 [Physcia stellaris]
MASSGQSLPAVATKSKFYEVPAMRVNRFVGRKYLLDRIQKFFREGASVIVLVGMGGQGKTQLSLEYCRAEQSEYSIFWVDATSMGTVNRSFEGIALNLAPGSKFPNPEAARTFVLKKFEDLSDPVLMIFDNYDKPAEFPTIRDYLPDRSKIIFNSRHTDAKRLGKGRGWRYDSRGEHTLERLFPSEEGVELLLLQSGHERTEENVEDARQIVEILGGLALAIDQAATYIGARDLPLKSFAEVFAKRRSAILKHTPTHWEYSKTRLEERDKPLSVFTTWEMSFEQLQVTHDERDSLVHLLTLGAFVNTRDISEGLFSLYAKQAHSIVRLLSVSLVTSIDLKATDARFSFHPLIAEWLKLRVDIKVRDEYAEEAVHVVRLFVDNGDEEEMPIRDKGEILSHLDAVIAGDEMLHTNGHQVSKTLQDAMVSFGSFYRRLGRYQETKYLIERALRGDHEVTPKIRNVLANMYCDRGDLFEAENLYMQILINLKETPPIKDPNEHLHIVRLGVLYWTQDDKLNASGTKLEGALTGDFSSFEPCKTLMIVNHLGTLEVLKGDFIAAERLLLRALAGTERQYGSGHTKTQIIICNLGLCCLESAQYEKAGHYLSRAARTLEGAVGPAHPFTVTTFHNQGLLHLKQHNFSAAGAKFERAIEGWKASGEGVAKSEGDSKYCLATIYENMEERRVEAEALLREAKTLYEHALGKEHPQTVEAERRADEVRNLVRIAGMKVV